MRACAVRRLALVATVLVVLDGGLAQTSAQPQTPQEGSRAEKINQWTLGLAAGLTEGTILRFGAEIARNVNDRDQLRVLPVVTPGAAENLTDLLYLKGIDLAITHADVFEHFKTVDKIPHLEKRINYISALYISELHVLVRPEINSFQDLEGKKVSFNTEGAGPSITGPILFRRLGVSVEPVYISNAIALEKMKSGEIAALLHTVGKPNELLSKFNNDYGFKFLPVPFEKFDDFYVPSFFTAEDYPGFVKPGETVETIGVQAVLAVHNWPRGSDRLRRVSRFIDYYFDRFNNFREPPYQPKWKSINLATTVPGWTRYWVAEEKLKQMVVKSEPPRLLDVQLAREQAARAAPNDLVEQERLFKEFIEWTKAQPKQ
jgi:TRAP transporter TAXI family solute receptor